MASEYKLRCSVIGHEQDVRAVAALSEPDGYFVSGSRDVTARVWVPNEEDAGFREGIVFGGHNGFVSSVCILPPSKEFPSGLIITGSNDHAIHAYTLDSPEPKFKLNGHTGNVCALAAGKFGTLISGSWDKSARVWLNQKCIMTLQGHEAAVWGVAIVPESGCMLTASADKTIKLWKAGKCERTYRGHEDCVRDVTVLSGVEFLSCSNDTTIRHWSTKTDACLNIYSGHTSFVYAVIALPNGVDFVSCGEDRMLRVWRSGKLKQSIAHPAQSVWSATVLSNGDVVTGASDCVIRVFTTCPERTASPEELASYEQSVAGSEIPAQIGDIKTEDLMGPNALLNPGRHDGQTLMIRRDNCIEAYQWNAAETRWIKVGNVVGGTSDSQTSGTGGKTTYEGKEYDFVFNVELQEGKPPLKLPYNIDEDPWVAAHNFLDRNDLSQMFLDQVANFIQQQTAGVTLGVASTPSISDPFTGGSRYVPGSTSTMNGQNGVESGMDPFTGSSQYRPSGQKSATKDVTSQYFPETTYIRFEQSSVQQLFTKLREFNSHCDGGSHFTESEINSLEVLVTDTQCTVTSSQIDTLWRMMQWPSGILFPVLDILRLSIRNGSVNKHFCDPTDCGPTLVAYADAMFLTATTSEQPKNHMLMLRTLCNAFQHPTGEQLILDSSEQLLASAKVALQSATDKTVQIALCSFVLNLSVGFRRKMNAVGKERCLLAASDLMQLLHEPESHFRLLVAIGTAIVGDKRLIELAASLELTALLRSCQSSSLEKVQQCAQQLLTLLTR